MAANYDFFKERADEAAKAAKCATLANVRERELRAEKTWRSLADQARSVAKRRETLEREKAVRLESDL